MYAVRYEKEAAKTLRKIPAHLARTIMRKVDMVAENPYACHANVARLQGRGGYRLRVGDWRVLYDLDDGLRVLNVEKIGPRGGIYRQ